MDHRLPATREMAQEFSELFVNRRAYTIQTMRPHPESGRHYYYRPKPKDGGEPAELTGETVRRHLAGDAVLLQGSLEVAADLRVLVLILQ